MEQAKTVLEERTTDELIELCIQQGISVPLEHLDDREALLVLLRKSDSTTAGTPSALSSLVPSTASMPLHAAAPTSVSSTTPASSTAQHPFSKASHAPPIRIIKNYTKPPHKHTYADFVKYFNKRYVALSGILKARKELQNVTSISRIFGKKEREQASIIGIVTDKKESRSKHIILTVEDQTGSIEAWIGQNNHELAEIARDIVLDEVIGIVGQTAGNRMFVNSLIFPDIPLGKELKKAEEDVYVVFVGDLHLGTKLFLYDEFEKMLLWLGGDFGTPEQREIAGKVKYVIFTGDLVEGVGVYPGQEHDLAIVDIRAQYSELAKHIKMIPERMQVVLIAGNHDAGRLQEPQPPIYRDFAKDLYELPNVTFLSNPCQFVINQTDTHPGFEILLYHGYSIIYYANNIPSVREAGGQKATEKIMRFYLQRRHLAPTHGCNTYVPDPDEDPLVIDRVPDFLVTGHVHRVSYMNYRNVTVINASCWNEESEEQEKRGLEAQPARLPVVNLRTRELRIMNFYHGSEEKKAALQEAAAAPTTEQAAPEQAMAPMPEPATQSTAKEAGS